MDDRATSSDRPSPPKLSTQATTTRASSSSLSPVSPSSTSAMTTLSPSVPIPLDANRHVQPYTSLRSPSSSFRAHPLAQRQFYPQHTPSVPSDTLPRIHLPAPNSTAPLRVGMDISPTSSKTLQNPPWHAESSQPRTHSLLPSGSARAFNFPSLSSSGSPSPGVPHSTLATPTSMLPPPLISRADSPGSVGRVSPKIHLSASPGPSMSLRPSYAPFDPIPTERWREPYERSPPLQSLSGRRSFSPERHSTRQAYYQSRPAHIGRSRSHSTTSRRSEEAGEALTKEIGAGQTRRMAHLMSEQKRRESVHASPTKQNLCAMLTRDSM